MTLKPEAAHGFGSVCVVGLGYIGLPTAAFIASKGLAVVGVDVNASYVEQINRGQVPFFEPDFESTLAGVVSQGRLVAQTVTPEADAYIVAVPTPFRENHEADLSYIRAAAVGIAPKLRGGELIVLESTSPPGATEEMAQFILEQRPDLSAEDGRSNSVYFAHCPERVLPGRIMIELAENDRVIGGLTPRATELACSLYGTFCSGTLLRTDATTAEMTKLTENAFRDVNIAFANELSVVCDALGINVWDLIELANHHPRVNILQPGPGVGGHCIAVDPWFIVAAASDQTPLIRQAREVNDSKPDFVVAKVLDHVSRFRAPVIAVLGLSFKADIDDIRESPSIEIVERLGGRATNADLRVVEPHIDHLPDHLSRLPNVRKQDLEGAVSDADIVLLLVDHTQFRHLDRASLQNRVVVDTKGFWR